jgi:hypothetical protein
VAIPEELMERKTRLTRAIRILSGDPSEFLVIRGGWLPGPQPYVRLRHQTRIRKCGFIFYIEEEFRDIDATPDLVAFKYWLTTENDAAMVEPIFRYECHPFERDPSGPEEDEAFQNPYGVTPHFHPDRTVEREAIKRLHYPFNRSERQQIVFGLIRWISVDLIRRSYGARRSGVSKS